MKACNVAGCETPASEIFDVCDKHLGERSRVGGLEILEGRALVDDLQKDLDWIAANSYPIPGERAAWRESWANVRLTLARMGAWCGCGSRVAR